MKQQKNTEMTAEEKEMLRRLMETPGIENEWDFFEEMVKGAPPPEFFMRGEPEPPGIITRLRTAVSNFLNRNH